MYLRKVTVRASDGTPREYLRLQESFREPLPDGGSKHRQRVICSFGRVDLLASHAARFYELLTGQRPDAQAANDDSMDRTLERRLKEAGVDLSANAALGALQSIRVVDFETVAGERVVTNGLERERKVLRARKIKKKPPGVKSEAGETARSPDVVTIRK